MSTISFDLSRSSFDPCWDLDSGSHDALWIQYLQTYSYTANGSSTLLNGTTVPTQGVTFSSAQGDIVFRRMSFSDRGGSIGSASANSAAVVTLDWTGSDSATLRLDRAWNTIRNAEVSNFSGTTLRVENFVDAWVHLADNTGRSITIEGAKRAEVSTGAGNDTITIGVESNNPGWTNEFLVVTGAGNDVIRYRSTATNYVAGQYRGQWTTTTTRAGDGDDTIYGWGSNDIVDGGAGNDQFILRGRLSDYTITTVKGVTTIVGASPCDSSDGRDRLVNIERIVDVDGAVLLLGTSGAPPNAAPIAGDDTEFLTGSGGVLGTVNLTAALLDNDVDPEGKTLTVTAVGPASLGSVALVSGAVQFTFGDAAYRALAEGQTATSSFQYTVADPDGLTDTAIATITVTGVNDVAAISGTSSGVVTEDGTLTASGSLAVSDADAGQALFAVPGSLAGTYGSFSFNATSGAWGYTLNNGLAAVQALAAGQSLSDSLTVASLDGSASRAIAITINGVNDVAAISGTSSGVVTEDTTLTASGSLAVSDADAGQSLFAVPGSLAGTYGSFSFNATSGAWGYTLNNGLAAVQALAAGQSLSDSLTVASLDGSASRAIAITINGVNDVAAISGTSSGVVTEDTTLTASGSLAVSDADAGQSLFAVPGSLAGTYGSFSFNATSGAWGYTLNNGLAAVQALAAGQSLSDLLTVASLDGTASRAIAITINGVNDTAAISGTSSGVVTEDTTLTASGSLAVSDADAGQSLFAVPGSLAGTYGSFSFNATSGAWGYTLNNGLAAVQALAAGQSLSDLLTVASLDGTASRAIAITINGVNDTAAISGTSSGVVTEDTTLTASGSLAVSDADAGQALFAVPGSLAGTYGSFSFNATSGAWGYTLNNGLAAVQALAAGQSLSDLLTVASLDGTASRAIAITINGVNDTAAISGTSSGVVTEDTTLTASGSLTVSDADDGQSLFAVPGSLAGTYGSFSFNATSGAWGYTLDNGLAAVQALAAGQSLSDSLTVASLDGSASRAIAITINGVNDGPVAQADGNGSDRVIESGIDSTNPTSNAFLGDPKATGNVLANDTDIDADDTKTVTGVGAGVSTPVSSNVASSVTGIYGSVTIAADGTWTYTLNNADPDTSGLNDGQTVNDVFTYSMRDTSGAVSSSTLTITIEGKNDGPIVNSGTITGTAGDDYLSGTAGTAAYGISNTGTIDLGKGNDILTGIGPAGLNTGGLLNANSGTIRMGPDTLSAPGETDDDIINVFNGGLDNPLGTVYSIQMGAGNDIFIGYGNLPLIDGGSGIDQLWLRGGTTYNFTLNPDGSYNVSSQGQIPGLASSNTFMKVKGFEFASITNDGVTTTGSPLALSGTGSLTLVG